MSGIVDYLHGIIEATKVDGTLTIVAHDFGVIYSQWLLAKYPADAGAIVQIDVGFGMHIGVDDHEPINIETLKNLFVYGKEYQYSLIALWMLNRTPATSALLDLVQYSFPDNFKTTDGVGGDHVIRPASAYSYFYLHLFTMSKYLANRTNLPQLSLYPDWAKNRPEVPILFLYGTKKPLKFHGDDWAASLNKRRDGSKSVALDTGHWVHLEKPELVKKHMDTFLESVLHRPHTRRWTFRR
jgi:pimeloyl-ACP methyl ester carboxylesterase